MNINGLESEIDSNVDNMPVMIGLNQLETMLAHGEYKNKEKLVEDIEAYKWLIDKDLCKEYLEIKYSKPFGEGQPRVVAKELGWKKETE